MSGKIFEGGVWCKYFQELSNLHTPILEQTAEISFEVKKGEHLTKPILIGNIYIDHPKTH